MAAAFLEDPYVTAHPESLPFWEAAERGSLLGKRCEDCAELHWHPRTLCPFCGSLRTHWIPLSGRGRLYAFSTLRRARVPYTVAYVQLDEGPILLTQLVDAGDVGPAIGMPVTVVFHRTEEGRCAPQFTPVPR